MWKFNFVLKKEERERAYFVGHHYRHLVSLYQGPVGCRARLLRAPAVGSGRGRRRGRGTLAQRTHGHRLRLAYFRIVT